MRRSFFVASERNVYLPGFSVTVQDVLPLNSTPVFLFTPGPLRWKLSAFVRSETTSLYFPATSDLTALAPFFSEIAFFGPTLPVSFVGAGGGRRRCADAEGALHLIVGCASHWYL